MTALLLFLGFTVAAGVLLAALVPEERRALLDWALITAVTGAAVAALLYLGGTP
ncbi:MULTISPECIES: hypothetical protein [Streptomyces]|uniref:hypothetical protein n=1 Tax=Streptomyces TaxID=1883 RepID=UPI00186ACD40|nr:MULTISPECIES: hypothetical protein [Streptomyces]